jgi:stress response protein YsnF
VLSERDLSAAIGSTAHGPDGEKIGTVESFFVDDRTGAPTWVAISTGLFGTRHSIVPATDASFADGLLRLPVGKDAVKHAPAVHGDHLGPEEEAELRRHYGIDTGGLGTGGIGTGGIGTGDAGPAGPPPQYADQQMAAGTTPGTTSGATAGGAAGGVAGGVAGTPSPAMVDPGTRPVPSPATDVRTAVGQAAPPPAGQHAGQYAGADTGRHAPDGAMTRSEEQLRVGTQRVAATRVRVVKYVVTEEVQVTVPLRREEIRIEEVPLDAPDPGPGESLVPAGTAGGGAAGTPGLPGGLPEDIVLHAERPVVTVEVVPVERVRLNTEVVQGQEQVTDQVRREQIVVDQTTTGQQGQPGQPVHPGTVPPR